MIKRTLRNIIVFLLLLVTGACTTVAYHRGNDLRIDASLEHGSGSATQALLDDGTFRVMTLNLAHGRGHGFHQLFSASDSIRHNLDRVADVIRRERVDVVALQEADAASAWSGGFNQVEYLLRASGLAASYQGLHVKMLGLQYGTALLSAAPLQETRSRAFREASLVPPRGYILATVAWPGRPGRTIDLVSAHLNFLSRHARMKEARELVADLADRDHPVILMGDFNTDWHSRDGVLAYLTRELDLSAYRPDDRKAATYPRVEKRYDWILVSSELQFVRQKILEDRLSDHRAVVAVIEWADGRDIQE